MIVKLKSPTIHAIRILKYMGEQNSDLPISSDICKDIHVTQSYFMRIASDLRKARLLESAQGRMGGFYLNRSLDQISLYDVIRAMEGEESYLAEVDLNSLIDVIESLNEGVENQLKNVRLAEL